MDKALKAFRDDLREAIDQSLDGKDLVTCFLSNLITQHQPWQLGNEIRTAIHSAIRESSNKALKQRINEDAIVCMILEIIRWERPLTISNRVAALAG
jgi:hypothetical protein